MKARTVYEFVRGRDPKESLSLGRMGWIRKFFRESGIQDNQYEITETNVIFKGIVDLSRIDISNLPEGLIVGWNLYLRGMHITELPKKLTILGSLYLGKTSITKLPEELIVKGSLDLTETYITELPEDLSVGGLIFINKSQIELIYHIKSSKFADKLVVWE